MTVYFHNPGELDLDFLRLMGVSVKEDSAIGRFGTGLKYACAVLLRHGCSITIRTAGIEYELTTERAELRGREFQKVYLGCGSAREALGFTTDLGKDWTPLMAYRELVCNAWDEGGDVTGHWLSAPRSGVLITVQGSAITEARRNHYEMFLNPQLLHAGKSVEVHDIRKPHTYFKGVKVHSATGIFDTSFYLTYNILSELLLTEDRTARSAHQIGNYVRNYLAKEAPREVLNRVMFRSDNMEPALDYRNMKEVSETFLDFLEDNCEVAHLRQLAAFMLGKFRNKKAEVRPIKLTTTHQSDITEALAMLGPIATVPQSALHFVEKLSDDGVGAAYYPELEEIHISREILETNPTKLASVIYEEWVHKTKGYRDCTRELQTFLFETLINVTRRLPREDEA